MTAQEPKVGITFDEESNPLESMEILAEMIDLATDKQTSDDFNDSLAFSIFKLYVGGCLTAIEGFKRISIQNGNIEQEFMLPRKIEILLNNLFLEFIRLLLPSEPENN